MARARSTVLAAVALLLTGPAANAQDIETPADEPAAPAIPRAWSMAERPQYAPGGWQCPAGLVWRNAGKTDWLCVAPDEADLIEQENERAPANWIEAPGGRRACRPGLVERQAFKGDIACVEPERRAAIEQMNLALYTVR